MARSGFWDKNIYPFLLTGGKDTEKNTSEGNRLKMVQCMFCVSSAPTTEASSSHAWLDYKCKASTRTHIFTIILKRKTQTELKFQPTLLYDDRWHRCPYSLHLLVFHVLLLLVVSLISSLRLYQSLCLSLFHTHTFSLNSSITLAIRKIRSTYSNLCATFTRVSFSNLFFILVMRKTHCGDFLLWVYPGRWIL